jgi:CRP-like cAMP-binding protein
MSLTTAIDRPNRPLLSSVPQWTAPLGAPPAVLRKLDALQGLGVFAGAAETDLLRLAEASLLRRFERGGAVLTRALTDACVFLIEGRAKTTMPRGIAAGEFALAIFEAGDIISEGCWIRQRSPEPGETVALEASLVLFLPRRALDAFLERNPRIGIQMLGAVATKLRRVIEIATENSCLEVADRLYRRLVELAASRGRRLDAGGVLIEHGLYQGELAAGIGASREAVNRQLASWRERGLVESGRRFVLVRDPLGLTQAVSIGARSTWSVPPLPEPQATT